jgi:transposase-like protein
MAELQRPAIFKWRQFSPEVILCAVRWYLRYSLSYRDVQELLVERGLEIDHTTVWRWAQRYAPELEERTRPHLKPTNKSWRVDETYVRVKGHWFYLYRAIDSAGATIDFLLSAVRSADAAKRLFSKALADPAHPQPRVINTDKANCYPPAILKSKEEGVLRRRCHHRPVQYLNNILEQDHRAIKKRIRAKQHFREFTCAWRTIQGYEAMHRIRKGQVRRVIKGDIRAQNRFIDQVFGVAA